MHPKVLNENVLGLVRSRYIAVIFLWITHERDPIARPQGRSLNCAKFNLSFDTVNLTTFVPNGTPQIYKHMGVNVVRCFKMG